jgi:hypothetical protein
MMEACPYCPHPMKDHCKGNVSHTWYKETLQQRPRTTVCRYRHCLNALCCCTGKPLERSTP